MDPPQVPESEASGGSRHREAEGDDEQFDSDEYRAFLRSRHRNGRNRRNRDDSEDEDRDRSNAGPAPEWNGEQIPYQDYLIKAKLWLATTRARASTRGPMLLQKLSGTPFEAMKHLAKDDLWMRSSNNGERLLELMSLPENFGEDQDEDLIASLSKITFHLRRTKDESHRTFFSRWETAMRKVTEHRVHLPDQYVGFLLINALNLTEGDIKNLLNYTRGSILPTHVREWVRKHETKLQVAQVGVDSKKTTSTRSHQTMMTVPEETDTDEEEIHMIEAAIRDLKDEDDGDKTDLGDGDKDGAILEEHEAAEVLSTMLQKKKSYTQTLKAKKSKELSRGYSNPSSSGSYRGGKGQSSWRKGNGPIQPGKYRMTIEEVKRVTRCGICKKVGHWHRECPDRDKEHEHHHLAMEEATFCGLLEPDLYPEEDLVREASESSQQRVGPVHPDVRESGQVNQDPNFEANQAEAVSQYKDRNFGEGKEEPWEVLFGESEANQLDNPNLIPDDACATIDTGCQRMAVGSETLKKLVQQIPPDIPVSLIKQEHRFRSVHGKSVTHHVASIPSALGRHGSLLRPAVFENEDSKQAPFLISLPFLLFCRTILVLDPQEGLKAHFKRLNFSVKCHLGPSGALRIPLCNFSREKIKRLVVAQENFLATKKEFEVLKTWQDRNSAEPGVNASGHGSGKEDPSDQSNGGMAADSQQDQIHLDQCSHVHSSPHETYRPRPDEPNQEYNQEGNFTRWHPEVNNIHGNIQHEQFRDGPNNVKCNGKQCDMEARESDTDPRTEETVWQTSGVQPRHSMSTLCMPEGGSKLSEDILEMRQVPEQPVLDVHLDTTPTTLESEGGSPEARRDLRYSSRSPDPETPEREMLAQEDHQSRIQRVQVGREVCSLREDTHGGQDREGDPGGREEGEPSSLQGVSEAQPTCDGEGPSRDTMRPGEVATTEQEHVRPLTKGVRHVAKQAQQALRQTENLWKDIMTFVNEDSPYSETDRLQHQISNSFLQGDQKKVISKKSLKHFSNLSGLNEKQLKTVAEVFNPSRFGERTGKFGLSQGVAFDLSVGYDLLKAGKRNEVRNYLETVKPGLVTLAPPCTLLSIMQNMNLKHRMDPDKEKQFLRDFMKSMILLNFAIEVARTVSKYGGTFLFEHPWTSKAWKQPKVIKMLEDLRNFLVKNDQCMFDLRSSSGELHRKPTGWLTNNKVIAMSLDKQCDGSHEHQPILGFGKGGNRSRLAQHYPPKLVDTILDAYRRSINNNAAELHHLNDQDLYQDSYFTEEVITNQIFVGEHVEGEPISNPEEKNEEVDQPYRYLPRERPLSLEQLVRRAHCGLGHPGNDKLARILKSAKASEEAVRIAKELRCPTCQQHQHTKPARQAAPPREIQVNEIIGIDTIWAPGPVQNGKQKMCLNIVDWSSKFQLVIPLRDHTPSGVRTAFYQWIKFFGPPGRVYCDLGREFKADFLKYMEQEAIMVDTGALEMPTQRSITERAGKAFKDMFSRALAHHTCSGWDEWRELLDITVMTKNRLYNQSGYSPQQRVLGYNSRIPGGWMTGGNSDLSTQSRFRMGDVQVQRAMEMRKAASIAFHETDCKHALSHAVHSGPRPMQCYEAGQLVYFWRKGMERAKKDNPSFWRGPARIILTSPPNTIWLSFNSSIIKAAPEQIRPANSEEGLTLTGWIDDIIKTREALEEPQKGYIILDEDPPDSLQSLAEPDPMEQFNPEPPQPEHRIHGKTQPQLISFRDPEEHESKRMRVEGPLSGQQAEEETQMDSKDPAEDYEPSIAPEEDRPNVPEEVNLDSDEDNRGERRPLENTEDAIAMEPPSKRSRTEFLEILYNHLEKFISQKKRKEVRLRELQNQDQQRFFKAITKEITTNIKSGAYEPMNLKDSEQIRRMKPEKVLKSRYVLTEKPVEPEDVEKNRAEDLLLDRDNGVFKAKARHVMKGYSENNAEDLNSTTPQVSKESVMFVLQILTSLKWTLGHLDFTQAFHSGDLIDRELYCEMPPEGIPGYHHRQLLRLRKTCYGLTDGPYAWYIHISGVLKKLGYQVSKADPCVFYLHDHQQHLQGIIALATDDMVHGGGDQHWKNMEWINKQYTLGKFSIGSGKFTGKEIEVQNDGSLLLHQQSYIQNLKKIPISAQRKKEKYSLCTDSEISELRTAIGGLAWAAKESRPDIAGRTALLQQCMPHPYVLHILHANMLIDELQQFSKLGIRIQPIPLQNLRVGCITDASWGNASEPGHYLESNEKDFWEETKTHWIRHHVQPRKLLFHPGAAPEGPDLHQISQARETVSDQGIFEDSWNESDSLRTLQSQTWTGMTRFPKEVFENEKRKPINERFLQLGKTGSQGGFIIFFYDDKLEHSEQPESITVANWKSYKLKRCTVNTLSAETQSLLQGIGNVHWYRFMLNEIMGNELTLENWEQQISRTPFIAVTDSKSLFDTINKCRNTSAHIDDKRTAIDLTILKRDLVLTGGQVRWVGGANMLADSLTKRMTSKFLRKVMTQGIWSLKERGFEQIHDNFWTLVNTITSRCE